MSRYVSLLLALTACGGGFNSSLGDDVLLTALTPAELCTLEEERGEYSADQFTEEAACYLGASISAAFSDGDYAATCQTAYDECIAAEPVEDNSAFVCSNPEVLETCTATVGELIACIESQTEALVSGLEEAACTEPDPDATPAAGDAACTAITTECGI